MGVGAQEQRGAEDARLRPRRAYRNAARRRQDPPWAPPRAAGLVATWGSPLLPPFAVTHSHTLSSAVHLIVFVSLSRLSSGRNLCACHIVTVFWTSDRLIWTSLIVTLRGCIFRAIIYAGSIQRTVSASISSLWSRFPTWCLRSLYTIPPLKRSRWACQFPSSSTTFYVLSSFIF